LSAEPLGARRAGCKSPRNAIETAPGSARRRRRKANLSFALSFYHFIFSKKEPSGN